ncbi:MAG: NUDIX hydrolase [Myxococcales bacterium]|nr:NUDIX hydrolase [Myxococcales bacterium]
MDTKNDGPKSTWADCLIRTLFKVGHPVYRRLKPFLFPITRGSCLAIWCQGQVLVIKNSYLPYYSFPGGGIAPGEQPLVAAVRECFEEVGIRTAPEHVKLDFVEELRWKNTLDTVWVYHVRLEKWPDVRIDNREVISASFMDPSTALRHRLFPPVRKHIERRV